MKEFDKWKDSLPRGEGYSAQEAFRAGMLAAADIAENFNTFPCALSTVGKNIRYAITAKAEKM